MKRKIGSIFARSAAPVANPKVLNLNHVLTTLEMWRTDVPAKTTLSKLTLSTELEDKVLAFVGTLNYHCTDLNLLKCATSELMASEYSNAVRKCASEIISPAQMHTISLKLLESNLSKALLTESMGEYVSVRHAVLSVLKNVYEALDEFFVVK